MNSEHVNIFITKIWNKLPLCIKKYTKCPDCFSRETNRVKEDKRRKNNLVTEGSWKYPKNAESLLYVKEIIKKRNFQGNRKNKCRAEM